MQGSLSTHEEVHLELLSVIPLVAFTPSLSAAATGTDTICTVIWEVSIHLGYCILLCVGRGGSSSVRCIIVILILLLLLSILFHIALVNGVDESKVFVGSLVDARCQGLPM